MPRHHHAQSSGHPVPPLNMEELKFWLRIMEEHAMFIRNGLPCDQPDLIEEAKAFQQEFKSLRQRAEKMQSDKKFADLVADVCRTMKEFIRYKRLLLCMAITDRLGGSLYPLFLNHVLREAEYFMALLAKMRGSTMEVVKAMEADFWLRVMDDHTQLIRQLLDPSECGIIEVAENYMGDFAALSCQSRDWLSMLNEQSLEVPAFDRFLQDSRVATMRLRDFKRALNDMVAEKRLLSIFPPKLPDHIRREADHFLLILAMMEKGVVKSAKCDEDIIAKFAQPCGSTVEIDVDEIAVGNIQDDIDNLDMDFTPGCKHREEEDTSPGGTFTHKPKFSYGKKEPEVSVKYDASADLPVESNEEGKGESEGEELLAEAEPEVASELSGRPEEDSAAIKPLKTEEEKAIAMATPIILNPPLEPVKSKKQTKFKWGGNWPRQLGKVRD
ncbi:MAG TPA: DUF2935 domain-containing protein [Methylomusa anaerophila]|uniref:DUF2935 domain-containing protein n=1 Tax=Methylomusa anaerophila TaxID=1930071 RepID=A0A348AHZ9_9FIRM|nr:DUF2935 domain-containing protein [Methylomusa anaerophila]BBB90697.1 hypothetical protein MAMMFC1_01358 [Methylomusa anaerophila]HML88700.1 DUF2935 domain-containing protein [Methylomusa anaerophila]